VPERPEESHEAEQSRIPWTSVKSFCCLRSAERPRRRPDAAAESGGVTPLPSTRRARSPRGLFRFRTGIQGVRAILSRVSPQRRTALVSVLAACALIALKLATGLATGSLGLVSEAVHSGTDLVAALLTFFAVGVAGRPADVRHQYGHGKAEHLAALAEGAFLVLASLVIAERAVARLAGSGHPSVDAAWYALVVVAVVIAVDLSRTFVSLRAARRYGSAALASNALHFGADLAGSTAVLVGLVLARAGHPRADSVAALFVAVLVLVAAARLMRRNVDVLMDRAPAEAQEAARAAIAGVEPAVELRRLRMRQAAGRHFADVVIGVSPGAAVGQGHAAADAVEEAVRSALPESDVVVHVEPQGDDAAVRERALAAALRVPSVREIHNVSVLRVGAGTEVSLHLKLPGELSLEEAHEIASEVEAAIRESVPEVGKVQTHLEPLTEPGAGRLPAGDDMAGCAEAVRRVVEEVSGSTPRELRFLHTDEGLVAFLTLGLEPDSPLADAHARASRIEEEIRRERPEIADVIVHTEP
jgi:cation diffusion facilitator family transporter